MRSKKYRFNLWTNRQHVLALITFLIVVAVGFLIYVASQSSEFSGSADTKTSTTKTTGCSDIKLGENYIKPPSNKDIVTTTTIDGQEVKITQHLQEEWSRAYFQLTREKWWQFWRGSANGIITRHLVVSVPTLERGESKEVLPTSYVVYEYQTRLNKGKSIVTLNFEDLLGNYLKIQKESISNQLATKGYNVDNIDQYIAEDGLRNLALFVGLDIVDQWFADSLKFYGEKKSKKLVWQSADKRTSLNILWNSCRNIESKA